MKVGIVGCGAIANIIVDNITPEENIEFKYFYDKDTNNQKSQLKKLMVYYVMIYLKC